MHFTIYSTTVEIMRYLVVYNNTKVVNKGLAKQWYITRVCFC